MSERATPAAVVAAYWQRIDQRDWDGLREVLATDVVVEWTATNEQFVGPDAVVAVNAEYPEGWAIHVRSITAEGESVASDVEVPMKGVGTFRVAAFMRVRRGVIESSVEYWIGAGAEEPPDWRRKYARPAAGRQLE